VAGDWQSLHDDFFGDVYCTTLAVCRAKPVPARDATRRRARARDPTGGGVSEALKAGNRAEY